jgi:hypothetical protein
MLCLEVPMKPYDYCRTPFPILMVDRETAGLSTATPFICQARLQAQI